MISPVGEDTVVRTACDSYWAFVSTSVSAGIALPFPNETLPGKFAGGFEGLPLRKAAEAAKSWNFREAGFGMAAVNAWYNTEKNIEDLGAEEPFENYCTRGIDFKGKKVAAVGNLKNIHTYAREAEEIFVLERMDIEGTYPDSACDYILPQCDVVIITGSSLVNKTLPHLLELSRDAYTILTGPSVPLCPGLFDFGADRIAGMVLTQPEAIYGEIRKGVSGNPYKYGKTFMLSK